MGLLYGLIFYNLKYDQEGIMNINSLLFLAVVYASVIYLFCEIKVLLYLKKNFLLNFKIEGFSR